MSLKVNQQERRKSWQGKVKTHLFRTTFLKTRKTPESQTSTINQNSTTLMKLIKPNNKKHSIRLIPEKNSKKYKIK